MVWLMSFGAAWLEIWIWTVSWSAIFNILIIPFFSIIFYSWLKKIKPEKSWINRDSLFYLFSVSVFLLWLYFGELLIMSLVLISIYIWYLWALYSDAQKNKKKNAELVEEAYNEVKNKKISYFTISYALILIYLWVEVAVVCASFIWETLWISALVVSLIVLAAVTSIPDTLLSVKSAKKWMINASLSNAVWSNIFDICIWLWVPIAIWIWFMWLDPKVDFATQAPIFLFLVASVIFYFWILQKKYIKKSDSIYFLMFYLVFIGYLVYISI
jgi:cation:H+ antiporter